ncbi:9801_t:CDS:2, partial [Rhizophagus irregularis]
WFLQTPLQSEQACRNFSKTAEFSSLWTRIFEQIRLIFQDT